MVECSPILGMQGQFRRRAHNCLDKDYLLPTQQLPIRSIHSSDHNTVLEPLCGRSSNANNYFHNRCEAGYH
ncbi:hypothetical protein BN873_990010 [Candidatus Competibacter denitrificans Run_A_D11]|uniref:Uncharacterized protein n=1 Tax=Candidatus Competibacter denitrificans Run_A_D11 TaxID=1400863 RepID=W6MBW0_9GAMM|nr:hypothetical protein BN873_990010 [Candidatus Competibacter denitrificans Run_A_D11]